MTNGEMVIGLIEAIWGWRAAWLAMWRDIGLDYCYELVYSGDPLAERLTCDMSGEWYRLCGFCKGSSDGCPWCAWTGREDRKPAKRGKQR